MKNKSFKTADDLTLWCNNNIRSGDIIAIVKDVSSGYWILFYAV